MSAWRIFFISRDGKTSVFLWCCVLTVKMSQFSRHVWKSWRLRGSNVPSLKSFWLCVSASRIFVWSFPKMMTSVTFIMANGCMWCCLCCQVWCTDAALKPLIFFIFHHVKSVSPVILLLPYKLKEWHLEVSTTRTVALFHCSSLSCWLQRFVRVARCQSVAAFSVQSKWKRCF